MAREIQSQSNQPPGGKGVLGQLANALFWVVVAIAVPVEEFLTPFPEFAPYAHWVPILFYVLALWRFLRAIRTLQRVAASCMWNPRIQVSGASGASGASRPVGNRRAKTGPAAVVTRPPTVQRMR